MNAAEQIDQIIQKYGRPAFELAMRQVYIDATISGLLALLCAITAVVLVVVAVFQYRAYKNGDSYNSHDLVALICGLIACLVGVSTIGFLIAASAVLNPEFAALQKLLPR